MTRTTGHELHESTTVRRASASGDLSAGATSGDKLAIDRQSYGTVDLPANPGPTESTTTTTTSPPSYNHETEWQAALSDLQRNLDELRNAKRFTFASVPISAKRLRLLPNSTTSSLATAQAERRERIHVLEQLVASNMRKLARIHPDPAVQQEWTMRADRFSSADTSEKEKEGIMEGLGKGIALLLVTPFALAGAALFATGALLYGTGKLIVGLGHMFTLGHFKD